MVSTDFELKLEEISMKIFENTTKKRSKLRTSYRTDFTKPPATITPHQFDSYNPYNNVTCYSNDQVMLTLNKLAEFSITSPVRPPTRKLKKSVRFADSLGLSLAKTNEFFLYPSEDPDLFIDPDSDVSADSFTDSDPDELDLDTFEFGNVRSKWKACFEQPGLSPTFYRKLDANRVLLESIHANHHVLEGIVRIVNLGVDDRSKVKLRYTFDGWKSYSDMQCDYLKALNFEHVHTDQYKFAFELDGGLIEELLEGNRYLNSTNEPFFKVQFALCYEASGESYWDNNAGRNYCFECYLQMIS